MGWPSYETIFALADVSGCIPNHPSDLKDKCTDTLIRRADKDGNQDLKTRELCKFPLLNHEVKPVMASLHTATNSSKRFAADGMCVHLELIANHDSRFGEGIKILVHSNILTVFFDDG